MTTNGTRRLPRYNGPASYTSHQRYWYCRARLELDVDLLHGQWHGPDWQRAERVFALIESGAALGPELWSTPLPA